MWRCSEKAGLYGPRESPPDTESAGALIPSLQNTSPKTSPIFSYLISPLDFNNWNHCRSPIWGHTNSTRWMILQTPQIHFHKFQLYGNKWYGSISFPLLLPNARKHLIRAYCDCSVETNLSFLELFVFSYRSNWLMAEPIILSHSPFLMWLKCKCSKFFFF